VVLKIRRRKFQHAAEGRNRHYAAAVPHRRERVSAERQALPAARYPGHLYGHRPGAGELRDHRAGADWAAAELEADDRRAIIEEAAGITRFKTKKRLAELRLESAKQNLARVDDIFEEVTRQMNSAEAAGGEGGALCGCARRVARAAARGAGQPHGS
jgi:hypothetical protein